MGDGLEGGQDWRHGGQLEDTFTNTGKKSGSGWRGRTDMGNQQWLTVLKY